jgi:hypothetical protein
MMVNKSKLLLYGGRLLKPKKFTKPPLLLQVLNYYHQIGLLVVHYLAIIRPMAMEEEEAAGIMLVKYLLALGKLEHHLRFRHICYN